MGLNVSPLVLPSALWCPPFLPEVGGGVWLLLKYLLGNSVTACFLEKPFESGRYRKEHAWRLMFWRESIHRRAAPPLAFGPKAVQTESTSGVCLAVKV